MALEFWSSEIGTILVAADQPARILLGRIAGAHGIRGEVLIHTYTEAPENIGAYGALSDAKGERQLKIKVVRVTPKGVQAAKDFYDSVVRVSRGASWVKGSAGSAG